MPEVTITEWLTALRADDSVAAQRLWETYFRRLVNLAERRLRPSVRGAADGEDIALSAIKSFCIAVRNGRFPKLSDGNELWRILAAITDAKAKNHIRDQTRQKRGGGNVIQAGQLEENVLAKQLSSREPSAEEAVTTAEQLAILLHSLDSDQLRTIAILKLQGECNDAIAMHLQVTRRTIDRKLQLIRLTWEQFLSSHLLE